MIHKTLLGTAGAPRDFERVLPATIDAALDRLSIEASVPRQRLSLKSVHITPLSTVGGWPFEFSVTVLVSTEPNASTL